MMGVFLAFSATLGVTWYLAIAGWLSAGAKRELAALADARGVAIDAEIARYLDALAALAEPDLGGLVRSLVEPGQAVSQADRDLLAAEMAQHLRASEIDVSARLLGVDGRLLAASGAMEPGDPVGTGIVQGDPGETLVSAPRQIANHWYLDVARPIRGNRGEALGMLRLRVRADRLLAITGDHRGLGETGETVLGERDGDRLRFLTPLRFESDPRRLDSLPTSGRLAGPLIAATAAEAGQSRAVDYRGTQVLATYRPILGTSWGMVVKQDLSEILEEAHRVRRALLFALVTLLGAALALVTPLVKSAIQPLHDLERATQRVAGGDLSVEVPEAGSEELRALGNSFNVMVDRLNAARAEALRRHEELESFSYVVSHDLKAPLRGVSNLSEWLEQDLGDELEPKDREHLRLLRDRVANMDALIDGLLEFSRVGRVRLPEQLVRTEDLVRAAVEILPVREGITVHVVGPLPAVYADPLRLTQVFQNLVGNAIEHHPGPRGMVEIDGHQGPDECEFVVRDDGAGIDARYHDRIFGIFQVLERRPGTRSTGIGLAIVKRVVEDHGGRVWVESEGVPGKGATFRFTWANGRREERTP